jgi:DNA-binding winged helix-turn-helix (wHTH) protein
MGQDQDVTRIRFGGFELQPGERRLLLGGQPMAIGPRAFNLLVVLVARAGHLVSKDELLDLVWPNRRAQSGGRRSPDGRTALRGASGACARV